MKTLKFLMALCVITLLTMGNTYAQSEKVTTIISYPFGTYVLCDDEWASGTMTQEITNFGNGHYLVKNSISMVGETSFALYESEAIINDHAIKPNTELGWVGNYTRTAVIKRNGAPYGLIHQTWHLTVNAKGEVTAEVWVEKIKCF